MDGALSLVLEASYKAGASQPVGVERVVKVEVAGRGGDYHVRTLLSWLHELREFLEEELGARLVVSHREEDVDYPLLYVDGKLVFEGLPGEEGYLIELIVSEVKRRGAGR
ncbi:MAG: hypothetical protein QXG48_05860 [Thermofilaceae archaeon]